MKMKFPKIIVTSGFQYLDIDAYACMVAMAELLRLQGRDAVAHSCAPYNYSVCPTLTKLGQIERTLTPKTKDTQYVIVDVSDPQFLEKDVQTGQVTEVYDHHTGFEAYWKARIGAGAHIEFVGAAATLIYRQWKNSGVHNRMPAGTAKLLTAAILDNTLNLRSANTTNEDIAAYEELCQIAHIDERWKAEYFLEVQCKVEANLRDALMSDVKTVSDNGVLPPRIAQLCIWDARRILAHLPDIRCWLSNHGKWLLNLVDIKSGQGFLVCDDGEYQRKIEKMFNISFEFGVARLTAARLRKEIIKKVQECNLNGEKI